jgi:hypothetical protein
MSEPTQPKSGGGCFSKLISLFLLATAAGLGSAIYFVSQPQDLSDLGGREAGPKTGQAREMKVVLKNSIERGYPVTLSEEEINDWLGSTLSVQQGGLLASRVSFERVWVRLEDGTAEVIMERKIMGRPFTVSMFLQIEQIEGPNGVSTEVKLHGGPFHPDFPNPPRGGRFGRLVVPQGFLLLVVPAYRNLTKNFPEEINLGFEEMSRIRIEKGRLVLDPRAGASGESILPGTF